MSLLALLLACAKPDPDAALRRHDIDGAAAAWKALHGEEVDLNHGLVDVLATRSEGDPTITMAYTLDALDAARLLDRGPRRGTGSLDTGFEKLETVLAGAAALASGPWLFAVGRSEHPGDADPYVNGALPCSLGRIVGWTRTDAAALGRTVDGNPPGRLVTLALRDTTGDLWITMEHRPGSWWTTASSDPAAAARVIAAGERYAEGGAARVTERYGAGLIPR